MSRKHSTRQNVRRGSPVGPSLGGAVAVVDVFDLDRTLVADCASFARSFTHIRAPDLRGQVDEIYASRRFWPKPLITVNPHFERGASVEALVRDGSSRSGNFAWSRTCCLSHIVERRCLAHRLRRPRLLRIYKTSVLICQYQKRPVMPIPAIPERAAEFRCRSAANAVPDTGKRTRFPLCPAPPNWGLRSCFQIDF